MTIQSLKSAETILSEIVAIPELPGAPNSAMTGWVKSYLETLGVRCHVLPGPEGDRCNLFATIGPEDIPGLILSGHMDVVPVEGQKWTGDPFRLTEIDGRMTGRGTTDMKGFLACVLSMVPHFMKCGLARPIHIAFSYDEEIGCRGVPHLISEIPRLCAVPAACIVGEPSEMRPVLSHKGKRAMEFVFTGKAAHSSNPALGTNAIYPAAEMLLFIRDVAARLAAEGPFDKRFHPSSATLVAGVVRGGNAVNIIPDRCVVQAEIRAGDKDLTNEVAGKLLSFIRQMQADTGGEQPDFAVSHKELSSYPPLTPTENTSFIADIERWSDNTAIQSVSYGTEAGLFQAAGIAPVICGPGSIDRAHRPDEYILRDELEDCCRMLGKLARDMSKV